MRRVYEQERRRKYLMELEDIESRRHMDNFTYGKSFRNMFIDIGFTERKLIEIDSVAVQSSNLAT